MDFKCKFHWFDAANEKLCRLGFGVAQDVLELAAEAGCSITEPVMNQWMDGDYVTSGAAEWWTVSSLWRTLRVSDGRMERWCLTSGSRCEPHLYDICMTVVWKTCLESLLWPQDEAASVELITSQNFQWKYSALSLVFSCCLWQNAFLIDWLNLIYLMVKTPSAVRGQYCVNFVCFLLYLEFPLCVLCLVSPVHH